MESSSNNAVQQASSNRELLRPRYAVRSRRQIQATVLPPVNESQEVSHRRSSNRTPRPRFRIGGTTSASRPVEAEQAEQPVNPQHAAANAWWNSRSAPVRVKTALTVFMSDERTLVEEPAMRPSKKPKTFHSRVSAIGHAKSVRDLFSSAAAFAQREKPASDNNAKSVSKSEHSPTTDTQHSTRLVSRLRIRVERASERFLQAVGAKEKKGSKESPSDIVERNYNTWQGFTTRYPLQSVFTESFLDMFTDSFVDSTEVLMDDETIQDHQSGEMEQEELAPAPGLPRV